MSEKQYENNFKFGIYQDNQIVNETIFSADVFNPVIRYSVDIRDVIPSIISRLQKTLSRRNLTHKMEVGNNNTYDLLEYYKNLNTLENQSFENKLIPTNYKQLVSKNIYDGVEFKFGLYINNNPIVERNFYVDGYNPSSRYSVELSREIYDITNEIYDSLKDNDVNHMWEDYSLIHTYGLYINQIRELSKGKRMSLLKNISNSDYVKKVRTGQSNNSN